MEFLSVFLFFTSVKLVCAGGYLSMRGQDVDCSIVHLLSLTSKARAFLTRRPLEPAHKTLSRNVKKHNHITTSPDVVILPSGFPKDEGATYSSRPWNTDKALKGMKWKTWKPLHATQRNNSLWNYKMASALRYVMLYHFYRTHDRLFSRHQEWLTPIARTSSVWHSSIYFHFASNFSWKTLIV